MSRFTFLIASARANGNTEQLARMAAESLDKDCRQTWLALRDLPLPAFQDLRHGNQSYLPPVGNAQTLLDATVDCDHLVFVAPVYWYSVPASLKLYLDSWSHWMRVGSIEFKDQMKGKYLWVVATSSGREEMARPMLDAMRFSADYMSMQWGGYVLGNSSAPGDVLSDTVAVQEARKLFIIDSSS